MKKQKLRRSGAKIMASLILLLGSLAYIHSGGGGDKPEGTAFGRADRRAEL